MTQLFLFFLLSGSTIEGIYEEVVSEGGHASWLVSGYTGERPGRDHHVDVLLMTFCHRSKPVHHRRGTQNGFKTPTLPRLLSENFCSFRPSHIDRLVGSFVLKAVL